MHSGAHIMSDSERLKGLLDGSIDPSEIEGDPGLYSMAERIYGRDALEEMGVNKPVKPKAHGISVSNGNGGVEIPEGEESDDEGGLGGAKTSTRPVFSIVVSLLCLSIVASNVAIGIGSYVPLCEDEVGPKELTYSSSATVNDGSLLISWTVTGMNISSNYSISWVISENGSNEVVDEGGSAWTAGETVRIQTENWMVTTPPYTYLSILSLEGEPVAFSNGTVGGLSVLAMTSDPTPNCDENTRLLWSELPEYNDLDSWGQAGTGGVIDGALMMLFSLITIRLMLRKR